MANAQTGSTKATKRKFKMRKNNKIPFHYILFIFVFGSLAIFVNSNDTRCYDLQQRGIESIVESGHYYLEGSHTSHFRSLPNTKFYKTVDLLYHDGRTYPLKQPGQFYIGSVVYFVLHKFGITYADNYDLAGGMVTLFTSVLMTAIMVTLIFLIVQHITQKRNPSVIIAFSLGFGTLLFPYSGVTHHDVYGTFFSFLSFFLLFYRYRIKGQKSILLVALSGFFLGFTIFVSLLQFSLLFVCWIYILANRDGNGIIWFGIFFIIGLLPTFIFNYLIFKNPLSFANSIGALDTLPLFSLSNFINNLKFYLISPSNAIFFYSPIFVISLTGFIFLPDKYLIEKRILPFAFFFLLAHVCTMQTVGHSQFGPRYLLPAMPFVMIGLSGLLVQRRVIYPIIITGLISIIICTTGSLIGVMYHTINIHPFNEYYGKIVAGNLPSFPFVIFGATLICISFLFYISTFFHHQQKSTIYE